MINIVKESAVIGFSGAASPLEPAWPSTHRALLPVAGKPVIVYLMEQLSDFGIHHVRIAGCIQQVAVRNRLGRGEEWGMTIRYSDLHGTDLCMQTLAEKGHCLYLPGDQMLNLARALDKDSAPQPGDVLSASPGVPAYWTLGEDGVNCQELIDDSFPDNGRLRSTRSFHDTNFLLASCGLPELVMPGRAISDRIHVGWDSRISTSAKLYPGVTVGNECLIGDHVQLGKGCVIGDGAIIRAGARLENVYVLPNTLVGKVVRLRDAIITPKAIFDLHDNYWLINDPMIIDRARSNSESITGMPSEALSEIETVNHTTINPYSLEQSRNVANQRSTK